MSVGVETDVLLFPLAACGILVCGAPNPPRSPSRRALCVIWLSLAEMARRLLTVTMLMVYTMTVLGLHTFGDGASHCCVSQDHLCCDIRNRRDFLEEKTYDRNQWQAL